MEAVLSRIKSAKILSSRKGDPLWTRSIYVDSQGDVFAGNPDLVVKLFGVCPPGEPRNLDAKGDPLDSVDPTAAVFYTEAAKTLSATSLMLQGKFETAKLQKAISLCRNTSGIPPMLYQAGGLTSLNLKDEENGIRLSIQLQNREAHLQQGREYFTYLDTAVMESFLALMDEEETAIRFFETPLPYFGGSQRVRVLFSYAHSHPNLMGV